MWNGRAEACESGVLTREGASRGAGCEEEEKERSRECKGGRKRRKKCKCKRKIIPIKQNRRCVGWRRKDRSPRRK